ncbi:MFS transporter [Caproiciproducens faecalis]|uniref:MFS transporter n=1 Tax=Caproiciproducens faecalis TaxID=2820301 RepID=A0ABS7DQX3_9FIRM|nr:MFS transporter [Caproiciproducens faecalis]MBW7573215.1 MFS transporter [Caproiciproducens faecalis]
MKYAGVHSFYWSVYCSSASFAAVFLLSKHFKNSQIGLVLAIANIFAVFLQPAVAAFADTRKISMKDLILILVGAAGVLAVSLCFLSSCFLVLAALFILQLIVLFTLQPLVNSLGMQLINKGISMNFGLARGMGSMAYAVCSVLLGVLVENLGADFLSVISVGLYIALGIVIYTFTNKQFPLAESAITHSESVETAKETENTHMNHSFSFFLHNKKYCAFLATVSLTFCSHSIISNYLIQITENVGGTAKEMGIATGIAAAIELPAMILFCFCVKKIRCSSILKFSLFFFVIKTVITMLATNVWMLYAAQLFQFSSYALFIPASIYYVNEIIKKDDLAKGQAFMTSAITLGGVAASLIGGWLLDGFGVDKMLFAGLIAAALGFILGLYAIERVEIKEFASNKSSSQ